MYFQSVCSKSCQFVSVNKCKMHEGMARQLPSSVPLPIDNDVLKNLSEDTKDAAALYGILFRQKECVTSSTVVNFAPVTLFPSSFCKRSFKLAVQIQQDVNKLIHRAVHDKIFMEDTFNVLVKHEDFINHLFNIYLNVENEGLSQPLHFGSLRSDYLMNKQDERYMTREVLQVEINTIAAGFAHMGTQLTNLHRYTYKKLNSTMNPKELEDKIPANPALDIVSQSMVDAFEYYGNRNAVVLFVVEDQQASRNVFDQRALDFALAKRNIRVIRRSFQQLGCEASLVGQQNTLIVTGKEVGLIYFRMGYAPDHYGTEGWSTRLLLERSRAIKCPSIHYHLATAKRFQEAFSRPGVAKNFLEDEKSSNVLSTVFAGQWALEDKDTHEMIDVAIQNPEKYLLKPQREGGGYNIFADEMVSELKKIRNEETNCTSMNHILMEKIEAPVVQNYVLWPDKSASLEKLQCELGIFGTCLGDKNTLHFNRVAGHCMRSKLTHVNEGGVSAGFGCIDSPYLIDTC